MSATIQEVLEKAEKPFERVSANTLFGEPIKTHGKTIIPVAKLSYGMMGGSRSHEHVPGSKSDGAWSNGGGRIRGTATPYGALEITEGGTQFIPFLDVRRIVGAATLAFLFGSLIGRRTRRDKSS